MKKIRILKNTRLSDLSFDELFDDAYGDIDLKMERISTRRVRQLRQNERTA